MATQHESDRWYSTEDGYWETTATDAEARLLEEIDRLKDDNRATGLLAALDALYEPEEVRAWLRIHGTQLRTELRKRSEAP